MITERCIDLSTSIKKKVDKYNLKGQQMKWSLCIIKYPIDHKCIWYILSTANVAIDGAYLIDNQR